MVLDPSTPVDPPLWGDGVNEMNVSSTFITIAMICVPLMLLPKPLILNYMNKRKHSHRRYGNSLESKPLLNNEDDPD